MVEPKASETVGGATEPSNVKFPVRVAIIDDGVRTPGIDDLSDTARADGIELLTDSELLSEALAVTSATRSDDPAENLRAVLSARVRAPLLQRLATGSPEFERKLNEHLFYVKLSELLANMVDVVREVDPFDDQLPSLADCQVVFLDYYLDGPDGGHERSLDIARSITAEEGRSPEQQIVLMSNRRNVINERAAFRREANVPGASFTFVPKARLDHRWQLRTLLKALERARPNSASIIAYQDAVKAALASGVEDFLKILDELDIDDYAYLQGVALMEDGDPLGEYLSGLLSTELISRTFEQAQARAAQRGLDAGEFPERPVSVAEPSTIVKSLFHSALISADVGPLSDHPRAEPGGPHSDIPLVRMGDIFFDADRRKAMAIVSADCDLAFSTTGERVPDADTTVLLVAGDAQNMRDASDGNDEAMTEGLVKEDEVFRIRWRLSKYQATTLGGLREKLVQEGMDLTIRDRLRPPFSFDLQQKFGAKLLRIGTPTVPPALREAAASIMLVEQDEDHHDEEIPEPRLRIMTHKDETWLRLTMEAIEVVREMCDRKAGMLEDRLANGREELESLEGKEANTKKKQLIALERKIEAARSKLDDDDFWISLHGDHAIGEKPRSLGNVVHIVLGSGWERRKDLEIVLQVVETEMGPDAEQGEPEEEAA